MRASRRRRGQLTRPSAYARRMRLVQARAITLSGDQAAWLLLAILAATACGLAVSRQSAAVAVAIPAAAVGAAVIPFVSAGVFVGLALILTNNAVPGLDLAKFSLGEANGTDLAFLALLGFAVARWLSAPQVGDSHRVSRALCVWSLGFLALWGIAFVRALDAGTDYIHALSTGRDFLYFGLTLPFATRLLTNSMSCGTFALSLAHWQLFLPAHISPPHSDLFQSIS
jgi:hypothetical protein